MRRWHVYQNEDGGLAPDGGGAPPGGLADSQKVTPSTFALQMIEGGKDGVWREILPPEVRGHKGFDNFGKTDNPLGTIAKSWIDMDRMYRESDKIPRLKADASEQDNAKYFQDHFGVPKSVAEYGEVPASVQVKVGETEVAHPIDPTRYEKMREAAHYMNMLPKQFEGLVLADAAMQIEAQSGREQHKLQIQELHMKALLEAWGPHAYEEKTQQATAAFLHFAPDLYEELDQLRDENGVRLTSHHAFRQMMAAIGAATKEATPVPPGQTHVTGVPTPSEATAELAQFQKYGTDEWNIMGDRNHTRHTAVKERYQYLMKIAHPGTSAEREAELGNDGML